MIFYYNGVPGHGIRPFLPDRNGRERSIHELKERYCNWLCKGHLCYNIRT